jgi:hypothetical protein
MDLSPLFSRTGILCTIVEVGIIVHLIFKRTEISRTFGLFLLLLAIPAFLTVFYLPHVHSPIVAVLHVFGLYWSTLAISILVHRVSPWHPLAKYPGPLVCKLTKFNLAFISFGGRQHVYYYQLHKKYGDVVRIGPNELSLCNIDAVIPLMGPNGLEKGPCKFTNLELFTFDPVLTEDRSLVWSGRIPAGETVHSLIAIVDKSEHARRRRSWTRGFTTVALKGYEALIKDRSLQLVDTLALNNLKETQNLTEWFGFFAYVDPFYIHSCWIILNAIT